VLYHHSPKAKYIAKKSKLIPKSLLFAQKIYIRSIIRQSRIWIRSLVVQTYYKLIDVVEAKQ
jgi:hypothetical protein